jgi:PAS domain S-box-containing protein
MSPEARPGPCETILPHIFNAIPDLLTIHDRDFNTIMSNWHGYESVPEAERQGRPKCYRVYHHRDRPCADCHVLKVLATGQPATLEKVNPVDGRVREVSAYPIRDESGRVILVAEHVRDITARYLAEQALKESEGRFRTLIEDSPESLFLTDVQGAILAASRVAAQRLGKSLEEIIGALLFDLFPPEVAARRRVMFEQAVATGRPFRREDARGDLHFDVNVNPILDTDGKVSRLSILAIDITDRKNAEQALGESEERFRMVFDYAPDSHFIMDLQGNFLDVNRGTEELTGYGREELIGRNYQAFPLFGERQNSMVAALFEQAVNGKILGPVELNLNRKDGGNVIIEAKGLPLHRKGESLLLGIARDITARKLAEEALRESERQKSIRNEIIRIFLTVPDEDMYGEVLQVVLKTMESRFGVFAYQDEHGALVAPSMTRDIWEQCNIPDKTIRFPPETWGDTIWARAIRQKQSLWKNEPGLVPEGHIPIENVMVMPLLYQDEVFAHFEVANKKGGYSEADKEWLEGIAQFIAPALYARLERDRKEAKRQVAVEALRESEARFRHISSTSSDISYSCTAGPDGIYAIDWLAGAAERITGYSVEEIKARRCWSFLVIQEDQPLFEKQITGLAGGASGACELRLRHKNGGMVWVASFAKIVQEPEQPELLHLYGGLVDISARKQAEEALAAHVQFLQLLMDTIPNPIFFKDAQGAYLGCNNAFEDYLGVTRQEIVGKTVYDLSPRELADEYHRMDQEAFQTTGIQVYESRVQAADGARRHVVFHKATFPDPTGGVGGLVGIITDITGLKQAEADLRESEQRFRLMAETIQDVFWIASKEIGKTLYVSLAFEQIWGRTREELYGNPQAFVDAIHPEDRERVRSEVYAGHRQGIPWSHEYRIIKPDGAVCWIRDRGFPVRDDQGRVTLFTGVATDITEHKALEAQLLQAQKMEAVGRLAGGVAHDFNNLLMAITGYGELMRGKVLKDDPLYGHLENILKAGDRAAALTRQLLTFSRQKIVHPQVIDLNQVVLDLEPMLRRLIGEDLHLEVLTDRRLGAVRADPDKLGQIIMNLVVNARDAMPQGGRLTLKTAAVEFKNSRHTRFGLAPPGVYVMLTVQDTGVGMDETTQANVFEPFYTTKEPGKGTGLGLSTVYGIVKQSGGYLDLASKPGAGSTFTIYLPRLEAIAAPPRARIPITASFRGEETVLLVEDEELLRGLLAKFLRLYGYTVLEARHGGEALLTCERHQGPIHVLVTDVVMPKMSGRELADRLAPVRPEMKVLYMSGYTEDALVQHGMADLSLAFLQKPFKPIELARRVYAVLHSPVKQ